MKRIALTAFGKAIKTRLIELDQSQSWLIDRVSEETGLYFDGSYLHKIMTGKLDTPKVVLAIRMILSISE